MSANFIRRFLFDPGLETLLEIESVNILDLEPPAQITGVGSGTVLMVGEFEDGPFEQYEVASASDFRNTYGTFGFEYAGVVSNNPCARARYADGALQPEYWNGNGFIALANKKFSRLICLRVDTSVGEVQFERLAYLLGLDAVTFDLEPGQTLDVDTGGGLVSGTFNAAEATVTSGAGVYPTTFTGGETMRVQIDQGNHIIGPIDIVFTAADQSQAQVISRINSVLGYTATADAGGGTTSLTGRRRGTDGLVQIVSADAAVLTATGFVVAATPGTGNVADIDDVTTAEVNTIISTADPNVTADRDADNKLRLTSSTGTMTVDAGSTAVGLGFTAATATAAVGDAVTIPAGTQVRNGSAVEWVTMQSLTFPENDAGPYSVKVRPALDDGTVLGSVAASVTVLPSPISGGAFSVVNPQALNPALTESQLDALYYTAILSTKSVTKVGQETNIVYSARQSNIIRTALRTNALEASADGCQGRVAVIRPPLGTTTRSQARGTSQPGVGAYRNQRVIYAYPGSATYISQIASRGTAGGAGFTDDGIIDVGADGFMASLLSQLPPELNPGQLTEFLTGMLSIEQGNADVQDMGISDYKLFKKAGIAAPRFANGTAIFQSGVTSVDPTLQPNLKNIARRRMADFMQDTLALRLTVFGKVANVLSKRIAVLSEIRGFCTGLKNAERIVNFSTTIGSDAAEIQLGMFRIILKATTISSMDSIVLESTIGESVVIEEAA